MLHAIRRWSGDGTPGELPLCGHAHTKPWLSARTVIHSCVDCPECRQILREEAREHIRREEAHGMEAR